MKSLLLITLFLKIQLGVFAQKKIIDSTTFDKWASLQSPAISADGKYIFYTIDKVPLGSHTLVVQSSYNNWKWEVIGASDPKFSNDGHKIIYKLPGDSICIRWLGSETCEFISSVREYQYLKKENVEWLILKILNTDNELRLYNILTKKIQKSFRGVSNYRLSRNGNVLLLYTQEKHDLGYKKTIIWVNLNNWNNKVISFLEDSSGKDIQAENLEIDNTSTQATFIKTEAEKGEQKRELCYYKIGMEHAVTKVSADSKKIPIDCIIGSSKFSEDGNCLFVQLVKQTKLQEKSGVMVDIWSYTDDKLQAQQLKEATQWSQYLSVINLVNDSFLIIQKENEKIYENQFGKDDYILLARAPCYYEENNWRESCRLPLYKVDTKTGARQLIKDNLISANVKSLSPEDKYVVFYDFEDKSYFCYNVAIGRMVNVSEKIPYKICDEAHARAGSPAPYGGIQNWLPDEKGIIIYDEYDIWQVDPEGEYSPICLTNSYGRQNKIVLRLLEENRLITDKQLLLTGFRPSDKANGFFRVNLELHSPPEMLVMGPYIYYWPYVDGLKPIKAASKDIWLVQRMNASETPNYFVTKNFKSFHQLSDLQPQRDYNWLTSELHEWTTLDCKKSQGILYKPENFDSTKKYPVIFHFYEEKSDELHRYIVPEATGSHINIPHFVSNGYLVFVPDIHYSIGETIESVYNSVVSAASYLAKYPWIDSTKLGLQGHSFGGYEVNALITRSNKFAAAASAAGASDLVSNTVSVDAVNGYSLAYLAETSAYRMGGPIWQKLNEYIKNSPVLYADRISTPLLMFNCKGDGVVPFGQGVEFFLALRRLDKRVWMLQYDNSGHQLSGEDAKDYTIRLMQFFDHYLKDNAMPGWMSNGIPAKLKGIATGYETNRENLRYSKQ